MLRTVFDNRLIFPPVSRLKMILECGFGAGDWSVDVAEQYPNAEVRIQALLLQITSTTQWRAELALRISAPNKS